MRRLTKYLHPLMTAILLAAGLPLDAQTLSKASDEYNKDFNGYTFKHTQGFPDTPHMMAWPSQYEDPDEWEFLTDEEKQRFQTLGIDVALPDFSFMTPTDSKYPLVAGQLRQRTHTVEHILYAMPGDLVPMYPYYRMTDKNIPDYEDKFSHWYDFTSGGCLTYELDGRTYDLIDFLDDRQHMHRSESNGFFGGETLNNLDNEWKRIPGTFANFYCPPTPNSKLPFKDGQNEFVIAADFSQTFSISQHIDNDNKEIIEPLIAFRHIFRIRDGRAFADEFSGSVEKNRSYINKHQKMVTAPAGKFFQIRLESPLPQDYRLGQSIYYFKRQDGTYGRVCGHDVRVINGDTGEVIENPGFNVWDREFRRVAVKRGYAVREADGSYYTGKADPDFVNYVTMLYISSAPAGHYIVQFLGKDENDNLIKLKDADGKQSDLVIMEYNVTFLPEEGASVVTEADLYGQEKFKHARDEQLREDYGEPADVIDFDEYIEINQLPDEEKQLKEKLISYTKYVRKKNDSRVPDDAAVYNGKETDPTANGKEHSFYKWPVSWNQSSYSFGYRYRHDYNMYMLATHSGSVPYMDEASKWEDNMAGDGSGLYDRLYYKTKRQYGDKDPSKVEQGYFYYVNAASDPGVSARLNITIPCQGSRIVVSAWVAEFSSIEETANISFNFVAVMKDTGERIVLHNFITGYVPSGLCGKWLNVYYSFVPRLAEFTAEEGNLFDLVDHYELELDNNTTSSAGADYAIDDIRAYVVPPRAEAEQLTFACDNDDIRLRLAAPFETLLEKIGKAETVGNEDGDEVELYYAYLDKEKFDALYDDGKGDLGQAYASSVVSIKGSDGKTTNYGKVTFRSNYLKNDDFKAVQPVDIVEDKAYRFTEESGERMVVFEHTVQLSHLRAGREYYVVFRSSLGEGDTPDTGEAGFFNADDYCANKCVSVIRPANTIKVDGEIRKDIDRLIVCENQSPVIQVNIAGKFEDGSIKEVEKNARFDWFAGTLDDFYSAADDEGNLLSEALSVFRSRYPAKETVSGIKADTESTSGAETLLQWMLDIIKQYIQPTERYPFGQLVLYRSSYVVPGIEFYDGGKDARSNVVAIPIPNNGPDKDYILCTNPTELELKFANNSPLLRHGLTDMEYPETMVDVPLRIGLEQIRLEKDEITGEDMKTIVIPVRKVKSTVSENARLELAKENAASKEMKEGCVVLVQTNDPEYRHLGSLEDGVETGNLLWVGEITELKASTNTPKDNLFKVKFDKTFDFKEGYFYKMRFQYAEASESGNETVCNGHDVFTLKIVPKYLLWTGGESLNWNCDDNWSRLVSEEIYSEKATGDHKRFVTDGKNNRLAAYSPLDFTYTVLNGNPKAPWLYAYGSEQAEDITDKIGLPTPLIQYDMAAWYPEATDLMNTGCKAWYAHTCKEIHFKPGATIMNQHELKYKKAWVDMELDHSRWYLLSSPFKQTFAGDFYLPTAGARQMTELFQPIEFDNSLQLNDRFRPAVYQRGWDKSVANVYELGKKGPRNVMVKTFWSHVYNDVNEQYGGGTGFSLKTDVSALDEASQPDRVLFRLPKADDEYCYFTQDKKKSGHLTKITRDKDSHYILNPGQGSLTSSTATEGQYFLVGNPLMTHLDIKEFLERNSSKIEPKFWVVTDAGQTAGNMADDVAIAPMQGFFVKSLIPLTALTLDYDEKMMRRYDADGDLLNATTRGVEEISSLRIIAYNDGHRSSATEIRNPEFTDGSDVEAIDNRQLDIPSVVYTVKAGNAMSICHDSLDTPMEIGILASEAESTTLRFEGVDEEDELMLYDKEEDNYMPLSEDMEINVVGAVSGRFYITRSSFEASMKGGVECRIGKGCLTVIDEASTGTLCVTVYDLPGRVVAAKSAECNTLSVELPSGVYVAHVANAEWHKAFRIVVAD